MHTYSRLALVRSKIAAGQRFLEDDHPAFIKAEAARDLAYWQDELAELRPTMKFKTVSGSTYTVLPDGCTRRLQVGAEEVRRVSERTVYISVKEYLAVAIYLWYRHKLRINGDRLEVFNSRQEVCRSCAFRTEPDIGLHPVEFWDGESTVHIGSQIIEVRDTE